MVVVWTPKAKEELKEILVYWKKRNKSNTYSVKLNTEAQKVVKKKKHTDTGYKDSRYFFCEYFVVNCSLFSTFVASLTS